MPLFQVRTGRGSGRVFARLRSAQRAPSTARRQGARTQPWFEQPTQGRVEPAKPYDAACGATRGTSSSSSRFVNNGSSLSTTS